MCYSALVERSLRKLGQQFGAVVDVDSFVRLYLQREQTPAIKLARGMEQGLIEIGGGAGRAVAKSCARFDQQELARNQMAVGELNPLIAELERKLAVKPTQSALAQLQIKQRQLATLQARSAKPAETNAEHYRIYPFYFAPGIIAHKDQRTIVPLRYRILPRSGIEVPSKFNVFNARSDSLQSAPTWRPLFGKQHAIFPFIRFFEWVEAPDKSRVEISFSPDQYPSMWAAALFEESETANLGKVQSFAIVTDAAPSEVAAAGHDRCPVFLKQDRLDAWLAPASRHKDQLQQLLEERQSVTYSHAKVLEDEVA